MSIAHIIKHYTSVLFTSLTNVRTDSSTEFGSDPILIDRIRIESAAGSNPILIVQIRTAVDRAVDFNERVTAFTTGEPAERVRRLASSTVAMPTYS